MNKLLTMLLEQLSQQPRSFDTADNPGFWSDGEMILCPSEAECEFTANFLRDLFRDRKSTRLNSSHQSSSRMPSSA